MTDGFRHTQPARHGRVGLCLLRQEEALAAQTGPSPWLL
jgi:hypothetical protein